MSKYTTNQFETALLAKKVQIEEFKTPDRFVREAIGYIGRKRMIWNEKGECFHNQKRIPENDLKLTNTESNEKN